MKSSRRDFISTNAGAGALLGSITAPALNAANARRRIAIPTPRARTLMSLFGLKYPILQAPHGRATGPELAIVVSNAGGMGTLALTGRSVEAVRTWVSKVRAATKGPFAVNYILALSPENAREMLQVALDAGAPVVQFSWGMPAKDMISAIRAAKAKFGLQVTSAESALAALDSGADYLVCQGTEAGGHVQANRGLYETLPDVLKAARQVPVIASGGIGNGEEFARRCWPAPPRPCWAPVSSRRPRVMPTRRTSARLSPLNLKTRF
jgi:nitronate monooxygenase